MRHAFKLQCALVCALLGAGFTLEAAVQVSQLTASPPSPEPVGTPILWQATATDTDPGTLVYRFSFKAAGAANFAIVRDYHPSPTFIGGFTMREGIFVVKVTVRNLSTQSQAERQAAFLVTSRVVGGQPVVNPTQHPLVFLYSAPACLPGSAMRVRFRRAGASNWTYTPFRPCNGTTSMNFLLGGMRATSLHTAVHEVALGGLLFPGQPVSFTTGVIPFGLIFSAGTLLVPPTADTSIESTILYDHLLVGDLANATVLFPNARDLSGEILWYYSVVGNPQQGSRFLIRPIGRGNFLLTVNDETIANPVANQNQLLREIDLAGNTVRETNATTVSEQLAALGHPPITSFHHDVLRLPNGHTLVLASTEKMFPAGTQGATADVDIIGDSVIDLDENLQVAWAWNSFDHMDLSRKAVLGETCIPLQGGCPPMFLAPVANDWLHSNSINWDPHDGSILISMRHQDWVVKINYANGAGSGEVIWRLGQDGDFTIDSSDPHPWFSHQHDAGVEDAAGRFLSLYDNGNTRKRIDSAANSRGQVLDLDEVNRTAKLVMNADLGVYAFALGNGHRLANGAYHFHSGFVGASPNNYSQTTEVQMSGAVNYKMQTEGVSYRSYRMINLYTAPAK